ncbi:MAG: hypothetical protein IJL20_12235 [Lachnospiraceae bacterium]|nr:hypothetical protein [Lachnospiraceae bacterium]
MSMDNKGFTLVELAAIVMILVILATISIPTFSKILSNTTDERNQEMAQDIMDHAQVLLYEKYANSEISDDRKCIIAGSNGVDYNYTDTDKNDCDVHNKQFSKDFLSDLDSINNQSLGSVVMIACGRCDLYNDPQSELYDPIKAYTVYMSIYQPYPNSRICFLTNDGNADSKSPVGSNKNKWIYFNIGGQNVKKKVDFITIDNETIYIQFYAIKNGIKNDKTLNNMWGILNKNYN